MLIVQQRLEPLDFPNERCNIGLGVGDEIQIGEIVGMDKPTPLRPVHLIGIVMILGNRVIVGVQHRR